MELGFLFWIFLVGIIVATLQDLKRREVDNWLNLLLLILSFSFVLFRVIFERNPSIIILAGFILLVMFIIMNSFYYGRFFGGGDAGLLFAMSVFFVGTTFYESMVNIALFITLLMISGAIYGLTFSLVLYFKNFEKVNNAMRAEIKKSKKFVILSVIMGAVVLFLTLIHFVFVVFSVLFISLPFLYVFAKGIEKISMIKEISGTELREGDWLIDDEKIGSKTVKANWEGVSRNEIQLLKNRKKVKIKEGIPFVPAFLIAYILYFIIRGWIFGIMGM